MHKKPKPKSRTLIGRQKKRAAAKVGRPRLKSKMDDTRERLIEAAIGVFAKKGFDGSTVKDLADAANVNVSLVSYYFNGKEGLYRTCLEKFGREKLEFVANLLTAPLSDEDFRLKIRMWLEAFIQDHIEHSDLIAMVHREFDQNLPLIKTVVKDTFMKMFEVLVIFFDTAKKKKIIRSDVDTYIAAMILHGSMMQAARTDSLRCEIFNVTIRDEDFRKKLINYMINIYVNSLLRGEK